MRDALSARERQVVRLISLGCTVDETAKVLGLSPNTVDNHKSRAMAKLGVDKTALLVRRAIKQRITKLNDHLTPSEKRKSGRKNDGWN
jgi:DNA-binding CsgD family transcriptional regulator